MHQPLERGAALVQLIAVAVIAAVSASAATVGVLGALEITPAETAAPDPAATSPGASTGARLAAAGSEVPDLADIVARATQSVVTITAQGAGPGRLSPFGVPSTGVGSGVVVTSSGLIVTNNHVVDGARELTVTTADGQELRATVVRSDPTHDLAVIRANGAVLVPATLGDSAAIRVGETVLAIGSPLGEFTETVTRGIVSAVDRSITVTDDRTGRGERLSGLLQTDAAINPGNSGGALINALGEVIGINTAVAGGAEGIGFAIPINAAQRLIDEASASIG